MVGKHWSCATEVNQITNQRPGTSMSKTMLIAAIVFYVYFVELVVFGIGALKEGGGSAPSDDAIHPRDLERSTGSRRTRHASVFAAFLRRTWALSLGP